MVARQHSGTTSLPPSEGLTIIGEGIHVNGRISGEEDLRIEGRVEGSVSLTQTVHVAQSGVVVATIEARDVVVSGVVVGNVSATNCISLDPGAKLVGDISAPRLIIADGAAFRGNVIMAEGDGPPRSRSATAGASRNTPVARSRSASGASRAASGSIGRTAARATPASRTSDRSDRSDRTSTRSERAATPRVAAIRPPSSTEMPDEEVTVVVRHAALPESDQPSARKKKAKKAPPRGRVPKRGKRSVNRR